MNTIEGKPKSLKQLLQNTKYSIHYYQREYMWQRKHIEELLDDLTSEFLEHYKQEHNREDVANYGSYFMGSIVLTSGRENAIIDGQQRLSSLTLLLIYLNNRLKQIGQENRTIEAMIFSESYGIKSYNLNVDDRKACMDALFHNKEFDLPSNCGESVRNLCERYVEIKDILLEVLKDESIPYFCDWLIEKVYFIEIVATTEQDAHKVFVTMNDRGLNLTSTEMLKGYLLSEIRDDNIREELNAKWKKMVSELKKDEDKGDEIFIKAWLRAHYAETIREKKAGAVNQDFDLIGSSFHKWIRDERDKLKLKTPQNFELFINQFVKYGKVYQKIREAETNYTEETKYVYYNARLDFTFQAQLLLAPIRYEDSWEDIIMKMNLTARYIDLYIISRVIDNSSLIYGSIKNNIFNLTKHIRSCDITDLKHKLLENFNELRFSPAESLPSWELNSFTKRYIKNFLARVTDFIERQIGLEGGYCHYMNTKAKNPFEIEHIVANSYEMFHKDYDDQEDFKRRRNNVGALLLLRKSTNASLKDAKYAAKLQKYCSSDGNIYAASLGKQTYQIILNLNALLAKIN